MPSKPILPLVANASALLDLAREGLKRVNDDRSDTFNTLATFVLLNSLNDWAFKEGLITTWKVSAPFYELIREVANGTKHLELRPKSHPDPHLDDIVPEGDWDQLDWADLGHANATITLHGRRLTSDEAAWISAARVLEEAVDWWSAALQAKQS